MMQWNPRFILGTRITPHTLMSLVMKSLAATSDHSNFDTWKLDTFTNAQSKYRLCPSHLAELTWWVHTPNSRWNYGVRMWESCDIQQSCMYIALLPRLFLVPWLYFCTPAEHRQSRCQAICTTVSLTKGQHIDEEKATYAHWADRIWTVNQIWHWQLCTVY